MRHAWIFDMLTDLRDYARLNDLPGLAQRIEDAIDTAHAEVQDSGPPQTTPEPQSDCPKH